MNKSKKTYAICSAYDGSHFSGWQIQPGRRTVQGILQENLRQLMKDDTLQLFGCSRTDAGVHARGHISHFHTKTSIPADRMHLALNSQLPDDIAVLQAIQVPADFHARFQTAGKTYSYTIWNHSVRPVIGAAYMAHVPGPLDFSNFDQVAEHLKGEHDFAAFRDQNGDDGPTFRRIDQISMNINGPSIQFIISGSGFLYHMVRILAGTMIAVAQGKIAADAIPALMQAKDRRAVGKTMPAHGLCLEAVSYSPPLPFSDQCLLNREGNRC